jgi:hypothetical protein
MASSTNTPPGKVGKPPHADPALREEICREFWDRVGARRQADMLMRDPAVRERRKILARIGEKLARHAGPVTEDEAEALTPAEIERRWAKLPSQDRDAFEKTPKLEVKLRYRRAKGFRKGIIEELVTEYGPATEYGLSANLIRHIVKGE